MKKIKFVVFEELVYYENNKTKEYILVKDPTVKIKFTETNRELFKEVQVSNNALPKNSQEETLYRVLADINTIIFYAEDTVQNMFEKTTNYLTEIQDFERLCVVRDIKAYYDRDRKNYNLLIKEVVNKNQK